MIPEFVIRDEGTQGVPEAAGRGTAADLIRRGQVAARRGERERAARLFRASLIADPSNTEARLWLAAIAEDPEESLRLLTRVLGDEPNHPRAVAGLRWACERIEAQTATRSLPPPPPMPQLRALPATPPGWRLLVLRVLAVFLCLIGVLGGAFLVASYHWVEAEPPRPAPVVELTPASLDGSQRIDLPPLYVTAPAPDPAQPPAAAPQLPTATITPTPLPMSPSTATPTPTATPTSTAAPTPTARPEPTPTLLPVADEAEPAIEVPAEGKWIEVDLSEQTLTAWEGETAIKRLLVSTGMAWYPTVTGRYRIYYKVRSQTMRGVDYYLPNVPHVMFFYRGFAIHGTYWHNDFGTPMSHGCVNLPAEDAEWLFSWAGPDLPAGQWGVSATEDNPGTLVVIHE